MIYPIRYLVWDAIPPGQVRPRTSPRLFRGIGHHPLGLNLNLNLNMNFEFERIYELAHTI